jgi:hypothetical protein
MIFDGIIHDFLSSFYAYFFSLTTTMRHKIFYEVVSLYERVRTRLTIANPTFITSEVT